MHGSCLSGCYSSLASEGSRQGPRLVASRGIGFPEAPWRLTSHQLVSLWGWSRAQPATDFPRSVAHEKCLQVRSASSRRGPMPQFRGGKLKVSTAFKERFKLTAGGGIKMHRPGFRHRRSRKQNSQRLRLKSPKLMHHTYANTMKRLGFK